MDRKATDKNRWLILCAAFAMLSFAPPAAADSNCTDAAGCGDALDDGTHGDNQTGDSGADRDEPDDKDKPS
jgi:hypothetical protein